MRHLRVLASLLGYIAVLIAIYRVPELWVKGDKNFTNSIVTYAVVLAVFLAIIFLKGFDCLEYFRLPRIGLASFSTIAIAAMFVSPRFWSGQSEMKPIGIALPGVGSNEVATQIVIWIRNPIIERLLGLSHAVV